MADRYWVGGTGTWSSTNTANWSTSSGGAGGASVPTAADNVIFDAGSDAGGIFTVTMANTPRLCNDFTASGLDFTMTLAGTSIGLTVSGSLSFPATNFTRTYTGTTTFNATTTGKTITTNGVIFGAVAVTGVGGAWTLGSAFSCGTSTLTLTNGTFDTSVSNYAVIARTFTTSNSNIRTINLNGSTVFLSSDWLMATSTNATLNAGTSTINLSATNSVFDGGGLTYYNVASTSTAFNSSFSVTGANTFNNLTFSTVAVAALNSIFIAANQTINGTLTVAGANGNQRMFVRSNVTGISRTLTCAAIASMTDVDFRDITIAGAHGTLSGTRLGDCGGNSNITFGAGANKYWNLVAGGNWSSTAWALSSGGSPAAANFPLAQDTVIIENTGLNTSATVTIDVGYNIGVFDMSTRSNAMTLSIISNPIFYENLTYNSAITPSGTGTIFFANRSIKTFDTAGKTFDNSISIDAPSGGVQLINNNFVTGGGRSTVLNQGTLDLNNFTITTGVFFSNNSNTRAIAFGTSGGIVLVAPFSGGVLLMAVATNFTFTGTSNISTAMTVSRTFEFGNFAGSTTSNRLNINLTSGSSVPTFTGSFRQINFTGSTSNPGAVTINCHGFTLASGGTYTNTDFTMVGTGTLTSNGKVIDTLTVGTPGITTTLQDALTCSVNAVLTLTEGAIDLNNFTLTTGLFYSTNSNTRAIAFGSTGSIVLTTTSAGSTVLLMATATNFTFTGTSNISAAMSTTRTFSFGNTAGATASNRLNINLTSGASTPTFAGAFRQINFTGSTCNPGAQNITCHGFTLASGGTYTNTDFTMVGTGTLTSNGKVIDVLNVNASGNTITLQDNLTTTTSGVLSTFILVSGTIDLNNFTLTTAIFDSTNSNTRAIAFGSTGSIVLTTTTAGSTVLSMATATNFTFTGTSNISAAMSVTRTFNFGGTAGATTSNRLNINTTSGSSVPTFTGSFRQINFTGSTSSLGFVSISCHGFTLASGGTYSNTTFTIVGDGTLTHTGKATANLTIDGTGITTTLTDAGQTGQTTLTNGTLNLAGFTLTNTSRFSTTAGTKNLTFNGGTLACSNSLSTAFNNAAPTNFTTTAGTGTGTISMTAATAKTFVGGGSTFNCTLNQGGAGDLTITGSNTFNNITNTVQPASVLFTAGTTSTFSNFSLSGTSGNLITIGSVTAASHTLSKASGTVSVSFCSISRSDATGGATWEALTTNGNVNGGNTTGWFFGSAVYAAVIAETATATDSVLSRAAFSSALAETATATDSGVGFILFPALVVETTTATDSVLSQAAFSSALSEIATATDSPLVAPSTFNAPVAETATATDSVISFADFYAALAETATTTDSILSFADFYAALTETATATDSPLVAPSTFNAPVAETATATDAVSPPGSIYNAPVSETVTISDLVLGAYLWNLIDDSQSVTWQNVNSSPGTVWSPIDTDPDTGWSVIPTVN